MQTIDCGFLGAGYGRMAIVNPLSRHRSSHNREKLWKQISPKLLRTDHSDAGDKLRDEWRHQNRWIFGEFPKGGGRGVIFNPKIYVADFGPLNRAFKHEIYNKFATRFSENEREGQRPFGTFPKIHPFWCPSLPELVAILLLICQSSHINMIKNAQLL